MSNDLNKIRLSLKNCEEVTLPYKFPYKCWIKYITIKGEDEAFYEGGEYLRMGDHKIFLLNNGQQICVPTMIRSDDGNILYRSRFFIDPHKKSKCEDDKSELEKIVKQQQKVIIKSSEQIKILEEQLLEYKTNQCDMISQMEEKNNKINELLIKENKYKLILSQYIN